ncbi:hypothetical protein ELI_2183 [Eubacterium callanderi]|uniref:Uncharacterized protein n=1 Tax=Eubacterium callanderi TaxID=53442 RepID=E3GNI1_9FIRM|nr:hypothetical protein ELI_2183 [Eubacterium callanderi]
MDLKAIFFVDVYRFVFKTKDRHCLLHPFVSKKNLKENP